MKCMMAWCRKAPYSSLVTLSLQQLVEAGKVAFDEATTQSLSKDDWADSPLKTLDDLIKPGTSDKSVAEAVLDMVNARERFLRNQPALVLDQFAKCKAEILTGLSSNFPKLAHVSGSLLSTCSFSLALT